MALLSSPVIYPPSSSPLDGQRGQKRKHFECYKTSKRISIGFDGKRPPLDRLPSNAEQASNSTGPFEDEDSDDGGGLFNANSIERKGRDTPPSSPPAIDVDVSHASNFKSGFDLGVAANTSTGAMLRIRRKRQGDALSYERMIAARSETAAGRATKTFYGIEVHQLLDEIEKSKPKAGAASVSEPTTKQLVEVSQKAKKRANMLWTEKYRARKFTDLLGDDRVHRDVLRWMKRWDSIVFPGLVKPPRSKHLPEDEHEKVHRKILLLTGPPGLGKTTLAHVCAKQAGYEVLEINASDDRSSSVVKGRVKDSLGTENVRSAGGGTKRGQGTSTARPVCVVVDEVDGAVTGNSNSGEGGFIKSLLDLVTLDQKNTSALKSISGNVVKTRRKGDTFRQLRPLILICNDVYHPALRPLRTSQMAEVIHIRRPPFDKVVSRVSSIFQKEGLPCDNDAVRKLCEGAWGPSNKKENHFHLGSAGDLRGCLVLGEWVAARLRASSSMETRLTKAWVDLHMANTFSGTGGNGSAGRGGIKEVVERVFLDNAGFAKIADDIPSKTFIDPATGVAEAAKKSANNRLRELADAAGDSDRIITDCFSSYASRPIQDDTFLSKPNAACEWLHFHDRISSKTHQSHEWELGAYLSQSILGFHNLFASSLRQGRQIDTKWDATEEPQSQFAGPRAHSAASEALKQNMNVVHAVQASLSIPLARSFRSTEIVATELVPQLMNMLTPDVKPIVVGGGTGTIGGVVSVRKESERRMIGRSVEVMDAVGVSLERMKIEEGTSSRSNYIYRMEP